MHFLCRDAVFQLNIDTFETTETNSSSSVSHFFQIA